MKKAAALLASTSVLAVAISAGSAQAFIVDISGMKYDVTTFTGSHDGNGGSDLPKFNTLANGGVMPWWGNVSLALAFANAVGDYFGTLNVQPVGGPEGGPYFAYQKIEPLDVAFWDPSDAPAGVDLASAQPFKTYTFAQASPVNSAVPGPLPLMGAAAAFGWSRKLRRRLIGSVRRASVQLHS